MNHPTKAQFDTVINNLRRVVEEYGAGYENNFDMSEGQTAQGDGVICGTTHCIGGWYAIATLQPFSKPITYTEGATQMARDLGFEDYKGLKNWAGYNSRIWGNIYGFNMFNDESAYNNARTLPEAIVHLEGVRDRLPE